MTKKREFSTTISKITMSINLFHLSQLFKPKLTHYAKSFTYSPFGWIEPNSASTNNSYGNKKTILARYFLEQQLL
jgi:hypothetical protein